MTKSFNTTTVRALGAVLMFLGLMLCIMRNTMTDLFVTVIALGLLVAGFYFAVSGIRMLAAKSNSKQKKAGKATAMMLGGFLAIALGVLALIYKGPIAQWILVATGAVTAVYDLTMIIVLAVASRGPRKVVLDMVLGVLTMVVGVLIALLVVPAVAGAARGLCFYLFGGLAIAVGGAELVLY